MPYNGDPANSNTDALRVLVGDTDESDELLTDEEYQYFLSSYGSPIVAAGPVCETLAAKFARYVDSEVDDIRVKSEQMFQHYRRLADVFRHRTAIYAMPYFGGVFTSDKENNDDPSIVQGRFWRDMGNNRTSITPRGDEDDEAIN